MKKFILVMLIAVLAVGFVFAEGFGKIVVGAKAGYLPQVKMAKFDLDGKWEMDFEAVAPFTTDVVAQAGVITDFKTNYVFDGFIGAGLTKGIGDNWDVYANCGLDMLLAKDTCELGVAANAGVEYYPLEHIGVKVNMKVVDYVKTKTILYEPSLGISYAF